MGVKPRMAGGRDAPRGLSPSPVPVEGSSRTSGVIDSGLFPIPPGHHPRPQGTRITGAAFTPHHRGITSDERMARRGMLHKLAVECIELRL